MSESDVGGSRREVEAEIDRIREHAEFLRSEREMNGKLYYALWILFMGGFVVSIGKISQNSCSSTSLRALGLLHTLRILAVLGSALNFLYQDLAINSVRLARQVSIDLDRHRVLADDKKPEAATVVFERANSLNEKLIRGDARILWLGRALMLCAAFFLTCSVIATWNVLP